MQRRGRCIVRKKGDYVSLIVDPRANYNTVVARAAGLLHLSPEKCLLCHVNGSKIINDDMEGRDGSEPWSVGHYLHSTYSKNSAYKLGILLEDSTSSEVGAFIVYDACACFCVCLSE